jgi:type I protein arginine methyltransferase
MKNIHDYGDMIADRGRIGAYAAALRASVTPDSVVLDIGTGAGILALLACQAGARKVYAVEQDGIIQVARESAVRNGYADRITFIEALSTTIDLPESVDIVVSEIHGTLPFFPGSLASIIDARDRFLKPGGALIPMRESVSVAVVSLPDAYERIIGPWGAGFGLDFAAGLRRGVCTWRSVEATADQLLVDPQGWCTLDYQDLESPSAKGSGSWTIERAGTGHGLLMWFDSETAPRCGFSNSPLSGERHIFANCFFPWSEPRALDPGDRVGVEIGADVVGGDYMWSWNTDIRGPGRDDSMLAQYRQSDLQGALLTPDWLRRSEAAFVPTPTPQAYVDRMTLGLLGEGLTLREVARRVADHFPDRFATWQEALVPVSALSRQYSR